jgi:hypothetical protein
MTSGPSTAITPEAADRSTFGTPLRSLQKARNVGAQRTENLVGKLTYNASLVIDFDDRTLAHLQIVITAKLRRRESFIFSWKDDADIGDGRTTIWLDPTISLVYKFLGGRPPQINKAWIEALTATANSPGGLHLVKEPLV